MVMADIPYGEYISPGREIVIESIFQFKDGLIELMPFLLACKERSCAVRFENEDIYIDKYGNSETPDLVLSIYASIASDPKICEDYISYLSKAKTGEYKLDRPGFIERESRA